MIYVYNTEAEAQAIVMTAYYLGYEAERIGSAVRMPSTVYDDLMANTYSPPATVVTQEVTS